MKKHLAIILSSIACLVTIFLVWESTQRPADDLKGNTQIRLQLQWSPQAQFIGYYVAKEKGFYQARKLEVTIVPGGFNTPPINAVISGNADIGSATGDQVLLAAYNLNRIKAVGVVFPRSIAGFMSKRELGVRGLSDLKGKKIGYYAGFDTENLLRALLRKAGVDSRNVTITPVTSIQAFTSGTVDLFPIYEINEPLEMERNNVKVDILSPEYLGIRFYSDTLFTTERFLRSNRKATKNFLDATAEGWDYARTHKGEAVDILLAASQSLSSDENSRTHQLAMLEGTLNAIPHGIDRSIFRMERSRWESMRDSLTDIGQMPKPPMNLLQRLCDFAIADE